MKKKKLMMAVVSASLVGVVAIGGTLAYLSDTSGKVTNTFTMGPGYITDDGHTGLWIDETKKDDGTRYPAEIATDSTKRVEGDENGTAGVRYEELVPGDIMVKDPTLHMVAGSVESRVVIRVSGMDTLNDNHFAISYDPITDSTKAETVLNVGTEGKTWKKIANEDGVLFGQAIPDELTGDGMAIAENDGKLDGYYVYNMPVNAEGLDPEEDEDLKLEPLFRYISLDKSISNDVFADVQDALGDEHDLRIGGVATQWKNTTELDTLNFAVNSLK